MQLRDYQSDMDIDINAAWQAGAKNVCAQLSTGGGKTVIFSSIIHQHDSIPSVAIAHRKELVSQIALALARYGVAHRIIGPKSLVQFVVNNQLAELGTSFYNANAPCAVAAVDTLIRRTDDLAAWMRQVRLWVIDECFPAGTLVDGRPIETVKVGDLVTAFNEHTGEFERRAVTRLFKRKAPDHMVSIRLGHHVLRCTSNHPIWTQRGWIDAGKITRKDQLYLVRQTDSGDQRSPTISLAKNWQDFLRSPMWSGLPGRTSQTAAKDTVYTCTGYSVPDLWWYVRSIWSSIESLSKNWTCVLQSGMFKNLSVSDIVRNNEPDKSKIRVRQNEKEKSDALRGNESEGFQHAQTHSAQTENARGKREATDSCGIAAFNIVRSIWFRIAGYCSNRSIWSRISQPLQGRLRASWIIDWNRSGWFQSLFNQASTTRQEKRQFACWTRVDDVQIFEPRNSRIVGDGFVYNLEVDGLHTYTANGFVVHNCHHVVRGNKWGKAVELFPNAKGLGVTATPLRADGKGLGRHADGVFDELVEGPPMRQLIDHGYLTDYRIFAPPSDLDLTNVPLANDGDFNRDKLKTAVRSSHVIGDVVEHYLRIARGKLGVTFATDVETASDIAQQFQSNGVRAEVVHAKTPDAVRTEIVNRFRRGEIQQLVNVDLFGEGFDLPAIEVCSMARPTQSYGLYSQQFGRALRPMDGKSHAIIIDHVGNVVRHGLPDRERMWSLDTRERTPRAKNPDDEIPLRYCDECTQPYERILIKCPYCGCKPEPSSRKAPEFVDGDLFELDPDVLAQMRGKIAEIDNPSETMRRMQAAGAHRGVIEGYRRNALARCEAQDALRESMAWWGQQQREAGRADAEAYRLFWHLFGTDVLSAQTLGRRDSLALAGKINDYLAQKVRRQ